MIEWGRLRIWRGSDVPLPPGQHDGPTAPVALEWYAPRGGYVAWFYVCAAPTGSLFRGPEAGRAEQALLALRVPQGPIHFGMTPALLDMLNASRLGAYESVEFLYAGWSDVGTSPRLVQNVGCIASAAAIDWPQGPEGLERLAARCQPHRSR